MSRVVRIDLGGRNFADLEPDAYEVDRAFLEDLEKSEPPTPLFPQSIQNDSLELRRYERRRQYAAGRRDAHNETLTLDELREVRFYSHVDDPRRAYWLGVLREAS